MTLHLYKDAALTDRISEGDLSNPDQDSYNGVTGESRDRELFLANEHTTLAAAVDAVATELTLADAHFQDGRVIATGPEQMRIVAGGGTTQLLVERGIDGTTAVPHAQDAVVVSGYDYTDITVQPEDIAGTDEATWYRLALDQAGLDAAIPGAALNLGDKPHAATLSFWRRCTVPPDTPVQNKTDLRLRIQATENPIF